MTLTPSLPDPIPLRPYARAARLRREAAGRMRPPKRVSVSQAAELYRVLHNPGGGYSGPWHNAEVPYLVEPMDALTRRDVAGVVFVGAAQSAKTSALIENPIVHAVTCDPADMLIVQPSEVIARDFSRRRLGPLNRRSPELRKRLGKSKGDDNVHDKRYDGMLLTIGWAAISQLSGRDIPRILLTDVDRMDLDVEGEGSPFDLAKQRNKTFGSRGYIVAESSPGNVCRDPKWTPSTPHEAPPAPGILALYNRGDRRRFYWPCPQCGEYFEGAFKHLTWRDEGDPEASAETVAMACPANGCLINPAQRAAISEIGVAHWLAEGQTIDAKGRIHGIGRRASLRSYWLKGPVATWQSWRDLVLRYLLALAEYERTRDEGALISTVHQDQGEAYVPKSLGAADSLGAAELIERAEGYRAREVPERAVFLTAGVDVQKNTFQVVVRAWGPELESWPIDYFQIYQAPKGTDRLLEPGVYKADWDLLIGEVLERRYPIAGHDGATMGLVRVAVDSAGRPGVTDKAYSFWRRCRKKGIRNLLLTKGTGTKDAPRVALRYPDTARRDRKAKARGEIPVGFYQTDTLKDELDAQLRVAEPGPRYLHLPRHLVEETGRSAFYEEITAEQRDDKGKWAKVKERNEALDCLCMAHVAALSLKADRIDWVAPPPWARVAEGNPMIAWPRLSAQALAEQAEPPARPRSQSFERRGL